MKLNPLRRKPKAEVMTEQDCAAGTVRQAEADLVPVACDYIPAGYPDGQSYASHAFGPSPGFPHCCFFCGMGASDPNHADYRAGATVDRDPATGRWAKRDGRM